VTAARTPAAMSGRPYGIRRLAGTGVLAALVATTVTTLAGALAQAAGADLRVPARGETIPLSGLAVVTGFFALAGVVLAVAFRRWSSRPARRFVATALALTVISLFPPLLVGAAGATAAALVGLHLVAAAVMIPALARGLGAGA
jgi:Family of unknown function (DUF6069)